MLRCKASRFSLPERITYLNCAYMSPILKKVEKAGLRGVRRKRNPVDIPPGAFFEDSDRLRSEFATLIEADASRIAIIPSVSYGIANAAANIPLEKSSNIVLAAEQFPSNYFSWERLCSSTGAAIRTVNPPDTLIDRGKIWNERLLEAIDSSTRVVALPHTHWADGTKFDLMAIRKRTRDVGALLIVDGTQSVGALPFSVKALQPDAVICAGYKWLLGPYSIGLAYYGPYFDNGRPIEESWINRLGSENFSSLVPYQHEYHPGALRYEVGEHSNFILVPMMLEGIKQLNRWHVADIQEYCRSITAKAIQTLRGKGFWIEEEQFRGTHLFGIRVPPSANAEKIKQELQRQRVYVSFRGDAIRVSPNVYNDEADLHKLSNVLRSGLS